MIGSWSARARRLQLLKSWEKISEWARSRLVKATANYTDLLKKQAKSLPPAPEEHKLAPQEDPDEHDLGDILVDKDQRYFLRRDGDYHVVKLNVTGEPHVLSLIHI